MAEAMPTPTRVWNRNFTLLFLSNLITNLGGVAVMSLAPQYADFMGAPETLIGFVTGAFALTAFSLKIISAPAIDAFNKKKLLLAALFINGAAMILGSFATEITLLIISRALYGVGTAFSAPSSLSLATEFLPKEHMASGIGYFSLAMTLGQAFAPAIGLNLKAAFGFVWAFRICSGGLLAAFIIVLFVKVNHVPVKKFKIALSNIIAKETVLPTVIAIFLALAYFNVNSFLIIYANRQGIGEEISWFFVVYAVVLVAFRPFVGRVSDKKGILVTLIPSLFCLAISFTMISFATALPLFLIAAAFSAVGYGVGLPSVQALGLKSVPPEKKGAGSCMLLIGQDVGAFAGPVLGGFVIEQTSYSQMWRIMIIPIGIALIITLVFRNKIRSLDSVQ